MDDLIVKTITKIITPFIQLYGIFVILHGHLSPGGGFAGGAIIGASFILFTLAFGIEESNKLIPHSVTSKIETGGILWFILLGLVGVVMGGSFLGNKVAGFPLGQLGSILSGGLITLATIGIGLKVASTMITLFHSIIEEES
ncbi:MAG: MnhB domain-containing protein [Clostridia bacterium]